MSIVPLQLVSIPLTAAIYGATGTIGNMLKTGCPQALDFGVAEGVEP